MVCTDNDFGQYHSVSFNSFGQNRVFIQTLVLDKNYTFIQTNSFRLNNGFKQNHIYTMI